MKPRDPHRTEPLKGGGRCVCEGCHVKGLARATRKTRGQYMTEPSAGTALPFSSCPHSELERTTPRTNVPRRKRQRETRPIRLSL